MRFFLYALLFLSVQTASAADIVIYGGTASGVAAAIQASRMGKSAIVIEPSQHLGGLTSGGLGWTDAGSKAAVGGISLEFYQRVKKYYDDPKVWVHGKQEDYKFYRKDDAAMWTFEPKVAEQILRDMLKDAKVECVYGERLDRAPGKGVKQDGKAITSITLESGKTYEGKVFIDATYEGDLMAAAGVAYHTGREPNSKYGETLNGVARKWNTGGHKFIKNVSPFVKDGDPSSGLLPGIEKELPADGEGDHRLQAYCYRMCMSNVDKNRISFPKPANYDEKRYELLFRNFEAGDLRIPMKPDMMPNGKTDTNNNHAFSTDYLGGNTKFPDASYVEREKILADHRDYQQGLMWTLQNHERVPKSVRDVYAKWGLTLDEFTDSGNWGHQIYVREARRMIGEYVHSEQDCRRKRVTPESVGMGSYNMDSHNTTRYVTDKGFVQNEGDVQVSPGGPYMISYKSLVPKEAECPNLIVPVCVSSSHIAYGSIRMEPVFMVLGQSAATAAAFAIDDKIPVQKVEYAKLSKKLLEDKQVLELSVPNRGTGLDPKKLSGIVVDDDDAEFKGFGHSSSANGPFVGIGYHHDGAESQKEQFAIYTPKLPAAGTYEVRMSYSPNPNRATNVEVTIVHSEGTKVVKVNQRKKPDGENGFASLGSFKFAEGKSGTVTISNKNADGYVVVDAVQFLPAK